jgi:hypothetical protein
VRGGTMFLQHGPVGPARHRPRRAIVEPDTHRRGSANTGKRRGYGGSFDRIPQPSGKTGIRPDWTSTHQPVGVCCRLSGPCERVCSVAAIRRPAFPDRAHGDPGPVQQARHDRSAVAAGADDPGGPVGRQAVEVLGQVGGERLLAAGTAPRVRSSSWHTSSTRGGPSPLPSRLCRGLDVDRHVQAGAYALGHHAVVLEQREAALDAALIGRVDLRVDLHPKGAYP